MTGAALAPGDRLLLEQVLRDTGVERVPGRPGTADYMLVLARALADRLQRAVEPLAGLLGPHASSFLLAAKVFLIGVLALLVFVVIRWIVLRRAVRRRKPRARRHSRASRGSEGELARGLEAWASELRASPRGGRRQGSTEGALVVAGPRVVRPRRRPVLDEPRASRSSPPPGPSSLRRGVRSPGLWSRYPARPGRPCPGGAAFGVPCA